MAAGRQDARPSGWPERPERTGRPEHAERPERTGRQPAGPGQVLECVVNLSEGRDLELVGALGRACGGCLLDTHSDPDHNRSVFTLAGPAPAVEAAVRDLVVAAVGSLDIGRHTGVHPRFGVVDVVPWVALEGWPLRDAATGGPAPLPATWSYSARSRAPRAAGHSEEPAPRAAGASEEGLRPPAPLPRRAAPVAVQARDRFGAWAAQELGLPVFLYGPERSLPEVRRRAWGGLRPDLGPDRPHPTAGAVAAGARRTLVAYNLWLADADLARARAIAAAVRGPEVRSLAFQLGERVQVSCNLVEPFIVGPAAIWDMVDALSCVSHAELVGLVPRAVLEMVPPDRWAQLDLSPGRTIESRLLHAGAGPVAPR